MARPICRAPRAAALFLVCIAGMSVAAEPIAELVPIGSKAVLVEQLRPDAKWKLSAKRDGDGSFETFAAADLLSVRMLRRSPKPAEKPRLAFPGGERLYFDRIEASSDDALTIRRADAPLEVPLTKPSAIVLDPKLSDDQLDELLAARKADDKNRDVVCLKNRDTISGTLAGVSDKTVTIKQGTKDLAIEVDRVHCVLLDPSLNDHDLGSKFFAQARLTDGSVISAVELAGEANGERWRLTTGFGPKLTCTIEELVDLSFRNGRAVYLSDLKPTEVEIRPFLDDRWTVQRDRAALGGPLLLAGRNYAKGLGVRSYCAIDYAAAAFETFEATIGIDDSAGELASANFRVEVDGKTVYDSGEMTRASAPKVIQLPLAKAKTLRLIVDYARRGDVQDYADWCDARLIR